MRDITTYVNESSQNIHDDVIAVMCAVKCLNDDNANYSLELRTKKIKPSISEKDAFELAKEVKSILF